MNNIIIYWLYILKFLYSGLLSLLLLRSRDIIIHAHTHEKASHLIENNDKRRESSIKWCKVYLLLNILFFNLPEKNHRFSILILQRDCESVLCLDLLAHMIAKSSWFFNFHIQVYIYTYTYMYVWPVRSSLCIHAFNFALTHARLVKQA